MNHHPWRIAADTGGTFTDAYAVDPGGRESRCKVLSSGVLRARLLEQISPSALRMQGLPEAPADFYKGFTVTLLGAGAAAPSSSVAVSAWDPGASVLHMSAPLPGEVAAGSLVDLSTGEEAPILAARLLTLTRLETPFPALELRLATTRATNALLERKGSPAAFFVTLGFGDLLRIGDQRRSALFALCHEPRPQFYTEAAEVPGRVAQDGTVLEELDEAAVSAEAGRLAGRGLRHAAVALMHSHAHPRHEQRVRELLLAAGFTHVSISSEIAPFTKILPRAQSAVANAYLTGPVQAFVEGVAAPLRQGGGGVAHSLRILTSSGGLERTATVHPKDLLLSGPAGGAIGAANAAARAGYRRILTLDMGGTSTDVARIDGRPGYRFTQNVAGMQLMAPCVAIETVAAGGGSICRWTHHGLAVGPESAGSDPGPACYGKGGPLTITDVNLLSGRFDPARAPIPLDMAAARLRLRELHHQAGGGLTETALLESCLKLAVEHMADAIRRISVAEGYDPREYALLAFGGAGPQHACAVADRLGITTVLAPQHAGILSAVGLHEAVPERFAQRQVLQPLGECLDAMEGWVAELAAEGRRLLAEDAEPGETEVHAIAELRLRGQDTPVQIDFERGRGLPALYEAAYHRLFGYPPPAGREVEVVSLRVSVRLRDASAVKPPGVQERTDLGAGPRLIQDEFSTLVVNAGWQVSHLRGFGHVVERLPDVEPAAAALESGPQDAAFARDLVRHRLHSIVSEMGALLCRTAISTNVRERLDFSCALLDAGGRLVSSAPHIPVHLGALGVCVREAVRGFELAAGDTLITNHPAFGGSHLPDVTLITPVFDDAGRLLGYSANRAHHAEIGGITPGSMPATAACLAEEGVVIPPRHLVRKGASCFPEIAELLAGPPHPTRNLADNLADLHAQLAANLLGAARLKALADEQTTPLGQVLEAILGHSAEVMRGQLHRVQARTATQTLDDGSLIQAAVRPGGAGGTLTLDFTGTGGVHPGNLNATAAIVRSAVLYVLRLWLQEDLPLNEGLLEPVEIILPAGTLLNPVFSGDPARDPAVVGGNVEVSQRLVDTLLLALDLQACSQGTMNNFLFGNGRFGYYETIAGGTGAGPGCDGGSALHSHVTNTAITDPEVIEQRYPVRVRQFAIRRGSGGAGRWHGGDGVVREFEFLEPLTVSLLTQHRTSGPYGMHGGCDGAPGCQTLIRDGKAVLLPPGASLAVAPGDRVRIETPGGGGWGAPGSGSGDR